MKWEGEAPAEPETAASSEWRVANSFFLEDSAPALPKISAHQEMRPPEFFAE